MKITYDKEALASYVYFTTIGAGEAKFTFTYQRMDVGLDEKDQIAFLRIFESEEHKFQNRLKYALQHPNVAYDESNGTLVIAFTDDQGVGKIISWDANIDIDSDGQILGVEILFADAESGFDDGQERLYAEGKLEHISNYIVPFGKFY